MKYLNKKMDLKLNNKESLNSLKQQVGTSIDNTQQPAVKSNPYTTSKFSLHRKSKTLSTYNNLKIDIKRFDHALA